MAALLAGQSVAEVAREYRVPESTVSRWKKASCAEAGLSDDVGELLLGYLRETLTTLRVQTVAFRDESWLHSQNALEAAILHGVTFDKVIRLLESRAGGPIE